MTDIWRRHQVQDENAQSTYQAGFSRLKEKAIGPVSGLTGLHTKGGIPGGKQSLAKAGDEENAGLGGKKLPILQTPSRRALGDITNATPHRRALGDITNASQADPGQVAAGLNAPSQKPAVIQAPSLLGPGRKLAEDRRSVDGQNKLEVRRKEDGAAAKKASATSELRRHAQQYAEDGIERMPMSGAAVESELRWREELEMNARVARVVSFRTPVFLYLHHAAALKASLEQVDGPDGPEWLSSLESECPPMTPTDKAKRKMRLCGGGDLSFPGFTDWDLGIEDLRVEHTEEGEGSD